MRTISQRAPWTMSRHATLRPGEQSLALVEEPAAVAMLCSNFFTLALLNVGGRREAGSEPLRKGIVEPERSWHLQ